MLAFADQSFELLYQCSLEEPVTWSALGFCFVTIFSWTISMLKLFKSPDLVSMLLPAVVCAGLLNLVPTLLLVAGVTWRPDLYKRRWRLINMSLQILQILCWNSFRRLIFQQSLVVGSELNRGQGHSLAQSFCIENIFMVVVWLWMLAFPSDLLSDIAILTATLATSVLGNEHLCISHLPPNYRLATQQEPFRSIAQFASDVVLKAFAPVGGLSWADAPPPTSCAALLGFWEVVGWWFACLTIILREVVCRMLFWRASTNQSRARGSHVDPRAQWPFGDASVVADILSMLGVSCLAFALLLGCVLWYSADGELLTGVGRA